MSDMTGKALFYKIRTNILAMFRDRNYISDAAYTRSEAVTKNFFFDNFGIAENDDEVNYSIDLWGFIDTRKFLADSSSESISEEKKIPVFVHFSNDDRPQKKGRRAKIYESILRGPSEGTKSLDPSINAEFSAWKAQTWGAKNKLKNPIDYDEKHPVADTPDSYLLNIGDEQILRGFHVIVVYNGWHYAQNKDRRSLFFIYSSGENERVYPYDLEIIPAHSMVANITKHELVPQHQLLTFADKRNEKDGQDSGRDIVKFLTEEAVRYLNDQDLEKYQKLSPDQKFRFMESYMFAIMPKIQLYDPVNMWYFGRLRQIYRIVRQGQAVTYRIVKKSPLMQDTRKN